MSKVLRAAEFAAIKHRHQRRKGSNPADVPYIEHPLGVARLLSEAGASEDVIVAGLLHDTVEDTDTTLEELECMFGSTVAYLVQQVTDDKTLPSATRKALQIEHAATAHPDVCMIKAADKFHNMRELLHNPPVSWTPERKHGYFLWARCVVRALAPRIGDFLLDKLNTLFQELEDNELDLPDPDDEAAVKAELEKYYALL